VICKLGDEGIIGEVGFHALILPSIWPFSKLSKFSPVN